MQAILLKILLFLFFYTKSISRNKYIILKNHFFFVYGYNSNHYTYKTYINISVIYSLLLIIIIVIPTYKIIYTPIIHDTQLLLSRMKYILT